MALTARQEAFVDAYIRLRNGAAAAREAGYSEQSASRLAQKVLDNPEVKAAIQARFRQKAMDTDEYLGNVAEIARGEWGPYVEVDDSGRIVSVNVRQLQRDGLGHLIQGVKQERSGPRVMFPDRIAALKLIGQGLGLLGNTASEGDLAAFIERFSPKGDSDERQQD